MEVGDLGEEDLDYPEDHHVQGIVDAAVGCAAVLVETVGLVYSPVELFIIQSEVPTTSSAFHCNFCDR